MSDMNPASDAEESAESLMKKASGLLAALETNVRLMSRQEDDLYPVFYEDRVLRVSLPYAAFERSQMHMATRHTLVEPTLVRMIVNLIPPFEGDATLVEVGAFSGAMALMLRALLKPSVTHLIEGQAVMQDSLEKTIKAQGRKGGRMVLHHAVIGEAGQKMKIAANRPERLAETTFLRSEEGDRDAVALDSLSLGDVRLLILDYAGSKIDALRGARETIARHRPAIVVDQSGRDMGEITDLLSEFDFTQTVVGKNHALFLPN